MLLLYACILKSHVLVKQDVKLLIVLLIKTLCRRHIVKHTLAVYFTYTIDDYFSVAQL